MATRFSPNFASFDAMAVGPEARRVVTEAAKKAKAVAEGLAQDFRVTGDYASSFEVAEETTVLAGHERAAALVKNTSDHASSVEWGYKGRAGAATHSAHRVFGHTLDSMAGA